MTASRTSPRVLLVNAPVGLIGYPHLGLGVLKAATRQAGFPCDVLYASVEFARRIGFNHYATLAAANGPALPSERIFAEALSPGVPSIDAYFDAVFARARGFQASGVAFRTAEAAVQRGDFKWIAERARAWVDEVASRPELGVYDVIGFSSSFGQHTASLALAKRIKERHPQVVICFGGANCEGVMGRQLVRSFPFVDYAFSGDGDVAFPLFLRRLEAGKPIDLPGVYAAGAPLDPERHEPPLMRQDLDELPYPDFDDFFAAYEQAPEGKGYVRAIPIEGSRGCWWGEKHHCTFCGLNGQTMKFRRKSPARFVAELEHLVARYGIRYVMATDNILDPQYIRTVLPLLAERRSHEVLFFEVKSNLDRKDLEAFAAAGVTEIQPGVESLSTHVLELIDKGVTALQNVQLLKWAEEYGITLIWGVLCGVPGETAADYEAMGALMEKIPHLQPPRGFNYVTIDRFAPYFRWPERWGITVRPAPAYAYVYDLPPGEVGNLAFWFCFDTADRSDRLDRSAPGYARRAVYRRTIWEAIYGKVRCCYEVDAAGAVTIEDTRSIAPEARVRLDALESAVFLLADRAVTAAYACRTLGADPEWSHLTLERVRETLDDLEDRLLLHREGDRYLALPNRVPARRATPYLGGTSHKSYLWRENQV